MSDPGTLAGAIQGAAADSAALHRRYGEQLALVDKVLGVVPNAAAYLEIWPLGSRTYHLVVPNLLNLPFLLFGSGPPKATVGLAMYTASRAAGCAYCTAHSCSFALRRGADDGDIVAANRRSGNGAQTRATSSALDIADALARVPASITAAQREAFLASFPASQAEWIVLAVAMMGFLNKFMDAMGIPLEDRMLATATEVIGPTGWTPGKHLAAGLVSPTAPRPRPDRLLDLLGILPVLPSVISRDKRWTAGVPRSWPSAGTYLRERTGHDFPVLSRLTHARAIRALATILRDNCEAEQSEIGLRTKHLAGLAYATTVQDDELADTARSLASHAGATTAQLDGTFDGLDNQARAALELSRAASSSPARIAPEDIAAATRHLTPSAVVELIVWISVMQLLHRLHTFYQ